MSNYGQPLHKESIAAVEIKNSAFYRAVQKGNIEIIKLLLFFNELDNFNFFVLFKSEQYIEKTKTALHFAIEKENYEIVKILLQTNDIDLNIKDDQGKTPIEYAKNGMIREIFE